MVSFDNPNLNEDLMHADSCWWAVANKIKLIGGAVFTLDGFEYIADIMRDDSREKVVKKAAQAAGSTLFMIDAIHGLIERRYPQGVIYYFPDKVAVENFSKTRFGPLISDNHAIRKHLRNTNSVNVKKVGNTFLSLLGASPTAHIPDKKDSTSVRQTPADYVIRDERDLFDDDMAEMTKDRLLNSMVKKEVDLGTPTIPDFGIDLCFSNSTQNERLIKCGSCNSYTDVVENFPNSIGYIKNKPFYRCISCGKEIFFRNSGWVARFPDREISGYHVSHFMNPHCDLVSIMKRWEKVQNDGKIGLFYNSILGLAYIAEDDKLLVSDVMACCGDDLMKSRQGLVGTAMGADIGKTNHVLIAKKIDKKRAKIIYMGRVTGFDALHDLAQRFNVKSAVIDLRPYEESFRKFQKAEPYKVFGCVYQDRMKQAMRTDDCEGIYTVNRTDSFDGSHRWVVSKQVEIPRKCAEVDEFARQMCNCAKVLETNDRGDRTYRYRPTGTKEEHYRNACNYLKLALLNLHDYQAQPILVGGPAEEDNWDCLRFEL